MHDSYNMLDLKHYPALDKGIAIKRPASYRNRFFAFGIVAIMILSGVAMIAPLIETGDNDGPVPASAAAIGQRETTYTISKMFESYLKSTDYSELGRHNSTMGLNSWWPLRESGYGELVLREAYPYVLGSPVGPAAYDVNPGYYLYVPYHFKVESKNVTGHAGPTATSDWGTDPGYNPYFVPITFYGDPSIPGGQINISLYNTYLTSTEVSDIRTGAHYGNTYYGMPGLAPPLADDGYWHEVQGHIQFDRDGAKKYLGLAGSADLMADWNTTTSNSAYGHDIELDWSANWTLEGGDYGIYDTYTGYEYGDDIRKFRITLDSALSTADLLDLRFWSVSWGNEVLLTRYMEAANASVPMQSFMEDWYLNITIDPRGGNMTSEGFAYYTILSGKDPNNFVGAWSLEATHIDYIPNSSPKHLAYDSPYNDYNPATTNWMRPSDLTGATTYGMNVSYWTTPMIWNLTDGEQIIIEMPSNDVVGYTPYRGASNVLNAAKETELEGYEYWGELVLGTCNPDQSANYDPATKTITLQGPFDAWAARKPNSGNPAIHEEGSPRFIFAVSKTSDYTLEILDDTWQPVATPLTSVTYNLRVLAKNLSSSVVTDWNGTVDLAVTGIGGGTATLGASSHTYITAENGNWTTTIVFNNVDSYYVNATDENYTLDVTGTTGVVIVLIPEFPMIIVPILGMIAIFLVFRTRKRQIEE